MFIGLKLNSKKIRIFSRICYAYVENKTKQNLMNEANKSCLSNNKQRNYNIKIFIIT